MLVYFSITSILVDVLTKLILLDPNWLLASLWEMELKTEWFNFYLVGKENALSFVVFVIVNPWVAEEVDVSFVWNVVKSDADKQELTTWEKILNIKGSGNTHLIEVPFEMNVICSLACSQFWQVGNHTFHPGLLPHFPFSTCYKKKITS